MSNPNAEIKNEQYVLQKIFKSNSLSLKQWFIKNTNDLDVLKTANTYDLSPLIAKILHNREVVNIKQFIQPTLKELLIEPFFLLDMEKVVNRTCEAIINKEKIALFADYDVDGATSSAIIMRYINDIGFDASLYIPKRLEEGYGPSIQAMQYLIENKNSLCIMLDCGTTAFDQLDYASKHKLDVVVLDHHTSEKFLPNCLGLVNPNRFDQDLKDRNDLRYLCTAGIAYIFIIALHRRLKDQNYFKDNSIDLRAYLDLVALGTVCDVMPLTGINRMFVSLGLKVANMHKNQGIKSLNDITNKDKKITAYSFGFLIGPRINAGGRVGKSDYGSKLLSSNCLDEVCNLSKSLNDYNIERQSIEQTVTQEAIDYIKNNQTEETFCLIASGNDWHPGVIGIVASRLKDKFNRPSLVITNYDGSLKGSGRSIPGIHLGSLMLEAVKLNLLDKGGGHAMACGFSVKKNCYNDFVSFMNEKCKDVVKSYVPSIEIESELSLEALNFDLIDELAILEPYGSANATPKFLFKNLKIKFINIVAEKHYSIILENNNGKTQKAMLFNAINSYYEDIINCLNKKISIVASIKCDEWNNKKNITLFIDDVML